MPRSKDLEDAVGNLLSVKGYLYIRVTHYRCYRCGAILNSPLKGVPDFLILSPKRLAVECKTGSGRLNDAQKEWKSKLESAGWEYMIVRDTVDKLLEVL